MKRPKNSLLSLACMLNSGHLGLQLLLNNLRMRTVTRTHPLHLHELKKMVSLQQEGVIVADTVATSAAVVVAEIVVIAVDSAVGMDKVGMDKAGMGRVNEMKEVVIGVELGVITVIVVVKTEVVVVRFDL